MTVYVLTVNFKHDESEQVGVFSTLARAQAAVDAPARAWRACPQPKTWQLHGRTAAARRGAVVEAVTVDGGLA